MGRARRVLTPGASPAHRWGAALRALRDERGLSLAGLGRLARYDASYLARLERGDQFATFAVAAACDQALGADGQLIVLWRAADRDRRHVQPGAAAAGPEPAGGRPLDDLDRQQILLMPLHAITYDYGEEGLRARFAAEIARLPGPAGRDQAARALDLAARLHAADRRQREPYVNHLLRVALRITVHYGVDDPDVITAALLHDAVEDHADALSPAGRDGAAAVLRGAFGTRAAGLVLDVTNPEYPPGADRHQQYREHVIESLTASPWARLIKASDFTDNGVGIIHTRGPKAVKLADKYAPLVPALTDLLARPDTPLPPPVKARILGQLLTAQERFAAITRAARNAAAIQTPPGE
jgi:transcriptional regulator with XRE-family HTH domain